MSFSLDTVRQRILSKLNDLGQDEFSDDVLLPHFQDAADELQTTLELNGILVLEKKSAAIVIPIGTTQMDSLIPDDMLEPQILKERLSGSQDMYQPMIERQWEPEILPTDSLRYWTYREQNIFFVGATTARQIHIHYLKRLITINHVFSPVTVNNAEQFMIARTAANAADFQGENETRADKLNKEADDNIIQLMGIGMKNKQGSRTRRRPFQLVGTRRWT